MAIVVVLVLLIAVGVGVGIALSGKARKEQSTSSGPTSLVSPTRSTFPPPSTSPAGTTTRAGASTAAARATGSGSAIAPSAGLPKLGYEKDRPTVAASPAEAPASDRPALGSDGDGGDDDSDEDLSSRFNPRGARSTRSAAYVPTVPRKPVLLNTPEPAAEPVAAPEPVDQVADGADEDPELDLPGLDLPELDLVDDGVAATSSSLEDDLVADVVAASSEVATDEATDSVIIDLDESSDEAPMLVLDDGPKPLDEVEAADNGNVLKALIGRVQVTQDDVDAVATELGRRSDLDAEGVADVLADLAEIAAAEAEHDEELTLFSEDVPNRPGQLTRFAELDDSERRRVIIRVLCLLVARADDTVDPDAVAEERVSVRDAWPGEPSDDAEEPHLPNRVGLVKS